MADHAVGRVDRLVAGDARKAADEKPAGGRHDAIRKILGKALDGRAHHTGCVKRCGIAADDAGDRNATAFQTTCVKRVRDGGDVQVQAPLGEQRCSENPDHRHRCDGLEPADHRALDDETRDHRRTDDRDARDDAACPSKGIRCVVLVEAAIEPADQCSDPDDRMSNQAKCRIRIANGGLQQQADERGRCGGQEQASTSARGGCCPAVRAVHRNDVTRRRARG
jgi:hypothetical protein